MGESWGERESIPVLVPVYEAGHHGVGVGARADEEQDDEEERLEVEDCCLLGSGKGKRWLVWEEWKGGGR